MIRSARKTARTAIAFTLWLAFAVMVNLAGNLGCANKATGSDEPTTKVPPVEDVDKEVSDKGKKWEGWRWQGERDSCQYVFKNECFVSEEDACKAADCGDAKCLAEEGAPYVVSCAE